MARPALLPGRLLEPYGDVRPRWMIVLDRTRLMTGLVWWTFALIYQTLFIYSDGVLT